MTCTSCGDTLALGVVACPACGVLLSDPGQDASLAVPLRPVRGMGIAVVVLLGTWAVAELFVAVVDVFRLLLINRVQVNPVSVDPTALSANDRLYLVGLVIQAVFFLAAVVVFLMWLFRARDNAERATFARHRRGQIWLVLGWVAPVVAFWFPKQIMDDIWQASDPAAPLHGAGDRTRGPVLVSVWWACWLLFWACNAVTSALSGTEEVFSLEAVETMKASTVTEIVAAPIGIAMAATAALVVRRISAFQEARRAERSLVLRS